MESQDELIIITNNNNLIIIITMHENFKHTYEYPPSRMRLGPLRISPLIGNIQVCILHLIDVLSSVVA